MVVEEIFIGCGRDFDMNEWSKIAYSPYPTPDIIKLLSNSARPEKL